MIKCIICYIVQLTSRMETYPCLPFLKCLFCFPCSLFLLLLDSEFLFVLVFISVFVLRQRSDFTVGVKLKYKNKSFVG